MNLTQDIIGSRHLAWVRPVMFTSCELDKTYSWPLPQPFGETRCVAVMQITLGSGVWAYMSLRILRPGSPGSEIERHRGADHGAAPWLRINEKRTMD